MNRKLASSRALMAPAFPIPLSRNEIEDAIERLIALLDLVDPDPDLEPSEDLETSLGGRGSAAGDDCELDTSDEEMSLGWRDKFNQVLLADAWAADCEIDHSPVASEVAS